MSENGTRNKPCFIFYIQTDLLYRTKSLFKTSTCWNFTILWYIYFPDTSKEAMCHTRFNFCYWWRNWITLNFLLFPNFHFSKTARNVSDSKKCGLYLTDKIYSVLYWGQKNIHVCVFQISRPYLGFCLTLNILMCIVSKMLENGGKCIEKCSFYVKYFDKIKCRLTIPSFFWAETWNIHIFLFGLIRPNLKWTICMLCPFWLGFQIIKYDFLFIFLSFSQSVPPEM